ncbi:hypothetical protein ABEB36_003007, partial [Hypothenemus hampei]
DEENDFARAVAYNVSATISRSNSNLSNYEIIEASYDDSNHSNVKFKKGPAVTRSNSLQGPAV